MKYDLTNIAIVENLEVIKERILKRGGQITDNVIKRQKRVEKIAKTYSDFSGTSQEVLNYLNNL